MAIDLENIRSRKDKLEREDVHKLIKYIFDEVTKYIRNKEFIDLDYAIEYNFASVRFGKYRSDK